MRRTSALGPGREGGQKFGHTCHCGRRQPVGLRDRTTGRAGALGPEVCSRPSRGGESRLEGA